MDIQSERQGGVARIEIARPAKKNALTRAMYRALGEAIGAAGADERVRALLIEGQAGIFSAGNDLEDFLRDPQIDPDSPVVAFMQALLDCEKPVVAAVAGAAVGIGATLLLHCDLVYLSTDAQLRLPFVSLGLVPEFGSSLVLPLRMGHARAAQALLLGEPIGAAQAEACGLASAVLAPDELLPYARQMASRFNQLPPEAVRECKRLLRVPHRAAIDEAMRAEGVAFNARLRSPQTRAAIQALLGRGPAAPAVAP